MDIDKPQFCLKLLKPVFSDLKEKFLISAVQCKFNTYQVIPLFAPIWFSQDNFKRFSGGFEESYWQIIKNAFIV
jgi:hypothetical protein